MLPDRVEASLRAHLLDVKRRHERDLADGVGRVVLPFALDRKYPNASSDWAWEVSSDDESVLGAVRQRFRVVEEQPSKAV